MQNILIMEGWRCYLYIPLGELFLACISLPLRFAEEDGSRFTGGGELFRPTDHLFPPVGLGLEQVCTSWPLLKQQGFYSIWADGSNLRLRLRQPWPLAL